MAIPGSLTPIEEKAEVVSELRGKLEDAKTKYEIELEKLFIEMTTKGIERTSANGYIYEVDTSARLKVKKAGK
jgi:hypothetical protein